MTQLITRYFETAAAARSAEYELVFRRRVSARIITLYEGADGLADALTARGVAPDTAKAYEERMAAGGAVMAVMAGYKPLGVAKMTREVTASEGAADMGDLEEEVFIKDVLNTKTSVLTDHPRFLTRGRASSQTTFHMADWPIPLISRREPFRGSLFPEHSRMANVFLPLTNRRKPFTGSIFGRHARMANFPLPLISRRKPFTGSIIGRHARMANFPLPLISRRKPFTGSIIGRHPRMANWPFPHLINGKQGTNSLVPGGARMANFPIRLLSDRKPFTGSIFPRHARMANFPLPLISKRTPFTGSVFPRHARMADWPIPLLLPQDGEPGPGGFKRSVSENFGIPTILRRSA